MLNVQVSEDNVNIVFSRNLISDKDLMAFLEKVRLKNLISRSQLSEEDVESLDNQGKGTGKISPLSDSKISRSKKLI